MLLWNYFISNNFDVSRGVQRPRKRKIQKVMRITALLYRFYIATRSTLIRLYTGKQAFGLVVFYTAVHAVAQKILPHPTSR
jgi:hypothetical protein